MEEKHFYYAEISENNICTAVLDTPVEITDNQKIRAKRINFGICFLNNLSNKLKFYLAL